MASGLDQELQWRYESTCSLTNLIAHVMFRSRYMWSWNAAVPIPPSIAHVSIVPSDRSWLGSDLRNSMRLCGVSSSCDQTSYERT